MSTITELPQIITCDYHNCHLGQMILKSKRHFSPVDDFGLIYGTLYYYQCDRCGDIKCTEKTTEKSADSYLPNFPSPTELCLSLSIAMKDALGFIFWIEVINATGILLKNKRQLIVRIGTDWYIWKRYQYCRLTEREFYDFYDSDYLTAHDILRKAIRYNGRKFIKNNR